MSRLTKRDEGSAYCHVPKCIEICNGKGCSEECNNCPVETRIIEKLGAYEDAEEQGMLAKVVLGEWIFKNDGAYGKTRTYCSACGKRSGIGGIVSNQLKPYCPNCGAKMNIEQKLAEMKGE